MSAQPASSGPRTRFGGPVLFRGVEYATWDGFQAALDAALRKAGGVRGEAVAVGARGAGQRLAPAPPQVQQLRLSAKAQQLGLRTRQDVDREFAAAKFGWTRGTDYHCPFCDVDLWSCSGARKHMAEQRHPVLRWDWYADGSRW